MSFYFLVTIQPEMKTTAAGKGGEEQSRSKQLMRKEKEWRVRKVACDAFHDLRTFTISADVCLYYGTSTLMFGVSENAFVLSS